MAKLGKGIIGTPQGVIGNVMCYDRLGKGIIQSRSYPDDAYHRRWNLLQPIITKQLTYIWDQLPVTWQDTFTSPLGSPLSNFDYYLELNLQHLYSIKATSYAGAILLNISARFSFAFSQISDRPSRRHVISIPPLDPFWSKPGTLYLRYYSLNAGIAPPTQTLVNPTAVDYSFTSQIAEHLLESKELVAFNFFFISPSATSKVYASGMHNSDLDYIL